jgi:prolyl oligopeptidase
MGAVDPRWEEICGFDASLSRPAVHGSRLFGLSSKDAPRFRVIAAEIADPGQEWKTVLPASHLVLTSLAAAKDALYIQALDGGVSRLLRAPYGGGEVRTLRLPFQGTIRELVADPRDRGVLVRLASWTRPSTWMSFDPGPKRFRDLGWTPGGRSRLSAYEELEVTVTAQDGATIPLSIVMRRGIRRDGTRPTILEAYGAYGAAVTPSFDPTLLAWLERGGIWAFAHVRGGGEFGEEWHQAGMKGKKINSITDFIACADYLVRQKFTSPDRLAAVGASAGGVVIGGALAKRPALFGAAVIDAGLLDCIRREQEANSQLGTAEFGTIGTEEGFRALLAVSPYHMIEDGSPFPAVLLMTALNDPRVAPWQSFKAAARLQAATASKRPVFLRLEAKGGHGVGEARSRELAKKTDIYAFLLDALTPGPRAGR